MIDPENKIDLIVKELKRRLVVAFSKYANL